MGFLRLTLHSIDFLAWAVLGLVYPLCASIRAIETGSKYHMRKLVTYWTIFSFISLFEHVFEKLVEWVPLWPYMKLITICWLVIPQFKGACYLYQNLIRPCLPIKLHDSIRQFNASCYVYQYLLYLCLSINLQTVTDWFNKRMEDSFLKNETFLAVAERYLEENRSDALEKLIANKVKSVKENPIQVEKKTTGVQVKEVVVPADAEEIKPPEITSSKQVQTEWTCVVCQMTTILEQSLKSHLNGRKHKAKCEGLKICKQTPKSEGSSPVATKPNQLNQQQVKDAAVPRSEHSADEATESKQVKSVKENPIQIEKKMTGVRVKEMVIPVDVEEIKPREGNSSKQVQAEWTCAVCQITTTSERSLMFHLNGRKHKAKSDGLKTCKQTPKNEGRSPVTTESNQLNPPQVKDAAEARSEQTADEAAVPKQVKSVKENPIQIEKKTTGVQVIEMVVPAVAEEIKPPDITSPKHVQTEWTCALCQMTTTSEQSLKSHLNGRKHKAKSEGLKTCSQTPKSEGSSPVTIKSNQFNQQQVNDAAEARSEQTADEAAIPKQVKSVKENPIEIEKKTTGVQVNEMVVPADAEEIKPPEITSSKQVQTEWTCALCQMTTTSERSLMSHLNGRKHKAKFEGMKACRQMPKSEGSSPVTIKSNQLNQQEVKDTAVPQSEHSVDTVVGPKQVKSAKEYAIQIESKTIQVQFKEMVVSADAEEIKPLVITFSKQVQTEWTCAVCQMTTTSEQSLMSHLNGKKHKAKSEGLKTCKQMPKSEGSSPVTTESNQLNQPQVRDAVEARSEQSADEAAVPKQVKSMKENPIEIEKKTTGVQVNEMVVPADAEEIKPPEITSSKHVQTEWTCALCQMTTTSEQSLKSHLNGRKHKAKSEGLKTCSQTPKSEGSSPVTTKSNQFNQQQVNDAAEARSEQTADEAAVPKQVKSVKENPIEIEKKTTGVQVNEMVVPADAEEIKPPEITSSKQVQTEWTCALCQMTTTSERSLMSHLNGRKHKAKFERMKACRQMPKSEGSSPVTIKSNQLNQQEVKDTAVPQSEQVKSVEENPIQIEKKTTGVQVKEMVVSADAEEIKPPVITSSKQVQTEWTCAVCQMTITSERSFISHLNGRKHKAKSDGPKTCKQMPKSEGSSPVTTESNQLNQPQVKDAAEARSEQSVDEAAVPKHVKSVKEYPIQIEKKTTGEQVKEMVVPADAEEIKPPVIISSKQVQTEWTCAVCQITTTSEQSLMSHINGRKHKAKSEGPKTCKQMPNNEGSSPVTTESNQLNQQQVKDVAEARSEQSADEAAVPKQVKSVKENPIEIEKKTTGVQVNEMVVPSRC